MFTDINGKKYLQINFSLQSLEPDTTPYKQRKPVFVPYNELLVCVDVPFDNEHVANYDVWAEWLLSSSGEMPMVILTTIGFEYVASKLAYQSTLVATADPTDTWDDFNDGEVNVEKVSNPNEKKVPATSWDEFEDVEEPTTTPSHDEKPTDFDTEWES